MGKSWRHPEIGVFEFEELSDRWQVEIDSPWVSRLRWRDEYAQGGEELLLIVESPQPDPLAVDQLDRFWADRDQLAGKLCKYVWADFQGELDSGNHWSGAVNTSISSANGLEDHMQLCVITVVFVPEEIGAATTQGLLSRVIMHDRDPSKVGRPRPGFWAVACALGGSWQEDFFMVLWRNGRCIGIGDFEDYVEPAKDYVPE